MKFSAFLYERPDFEQFKTKAEELYEQLDKVTTKDDFLSDFKAVNDQWNEVLAMYQLAYIRYTMNTKDPFYKEEQAYFDEMVPEFDAVHHRFYQKIIDCPWKKELSKIKKKKIG